MSSKHGWDLAETHTGSHHPLLDFQLCLLDSGFMGNLQESTGCQLLPCPLSWSPSLADRISWGLLWTHWLLTGKHWLGVKPRVEGGPAPSAPSLPDRMPQVEGMVPRDAGRETCGGLYTGRQHPLEEAAWMEQGRWERHPTPPFSPKSLTPCSEFLLSPCFLWWGKNWHHFEIKWKPFEIESLFSGKLHNS